MKNLFLILFLILFVFMAAGCAQFQTSVVPPRGLLVEKYKAPLMTNLNNTNSGPTIKASSDKTMYFHDFLITGLNVAWGETSIPSIARSAGIKNVTYADYEILNILGIYAEFTVNVYGY